jgi:glutathione S-transferase
MTPSIKLTYFDFEGIGEQIRLALLLSGTPYEDDRVSFSEWDALKPMFPFGQLPVVTVDGGPMHAQSNSILRWVGREFSQTLYPASEALEIDEAIGLVQDLADSWMPCFFVNYAPDKYGHAKGFHTTEPGKKVVEAVRSKWLGNELPRFAGYLIGLIEKNGGGMWLTSPNGPTIADCKLIPLLRSFTLGFYDHIPPNCLDKYPELVEYIQRFCALEPIQGRYVDGVH